MEQFKEFLNLRRQIDAVLKESSVSNSINIDLVEAQQNLLEAKQYYYQQLTLFTEIKELLLENNYGLSYHEEYEDTEHHVENIFKRLSETLSDVEAKNSLNITTKGNPSKEEQLFGLQTDDFELEPKEKKLLHQSIQQHCIPLLEKRLKNKSLELFHFWNPSGKDSEGLTLAKFNNLPATVNNEKKKLEEAKIQLSVEEKKYDEEYKHFYQNISDTLKSLEEKVESYTQKPHVEGTNITVDWLAAKCDYILTKIKVMKNHIVSQTYTNETLEALEKVRYHLDHEMRRTQENLHNTKRALYTYESVGDTFKKLLNEYTQLTTEIDNKKWALTELNKSGTLS